MMIIHVTWKHQPVKWVDDTAGGGYRPIGEVIEKMGIVAGYVWTEAGVKAIVIPASGGEFFEEILLSELSIHNWRFE